MKRTLVIVFAILFCLPVLISCSENAGTAATLTEQLSDKVSGSAEPERTFITKTELDAVIDGAILKYEQRSDEFAKIDCEKYQKCFYPNGPEKYALEFDFIDLGELESSDLDAREKFDKLVNDYMIPITLMICEEIEARLEPGSYVSLYGALGDDVGQMYSGQPPYDCFYALSTKDLKGADSFAAFIHDYRLHNRDWVDFDVEDVIDGFCCLDPSSGFITLLNSSNVVVKNEKSPSGTKIGFYFSDEEHLVFPKGRSGSLYRQLLQILREESAQ
ncbi:MAG: hypothetical protein IJV00_04805 [Clostridia bacterium]|nr:hypothetical protein [Clostridia bacterium]